MSSCVPAVAAALLLMTAWASPSAALQVYFDRIGPQSAAETLATDINNSGLAVGAAGSGATFTGFASSGGPSVTIHPPGWDVSLPLRIGDDGSIVGFGIDGGVRKGFLFRNNVYTALLPAGFTEAEAHAVGPDGAAGGWGQTGGLEVGFIYSSGLYVPVVPPGFTESRVQDINSAAAFVGSGSTAAGRQAFLFSGGYSFPSPPGWTNTEALRINDSGLILGRGTDPDNLQKCYLADGGVYTEIVPPGAVISLCGDMNNRGDVTGLAVTGALGFYSFVYRDGVYHAHDGVVGTLFGSAAINDSWQLAALDASEKAAIGYILPDSDLQAAGSDGPLGVPAGAVPVLKASLSAWTFTGRRVDWWLFAQTPGGTFSFDAVARRWVPGTVPAAGIRLRNINNVSVPPAGTTFGAYTYYFGVDLKGNGIFDPQFFVFDRIDIFVR